MKIEKKRFFTLEPGSTNGFFTFDPKSVPGFGLPDHDCLRSDHASTINGQQLIVTKIRHVPKPILLSIDSIGIDDIAVLVGIDIN